MVVVSGVLVCAMCVCMCACGQVGMSFSALCSGAHVTCINVSNSLHSPQ